MKEQTLKALNVEWAVRVYIDTVSYSNPLPPWIQPAEFSYKSIAEKIENKIRRYHTHGEDTGAAFEIVIPYRPEDRRTWHIPSINEQIILQACMAYLSPSLAPNGSTKARVFTYQKDPGNSEFLNQQLEGWLAFQNETTKRLETSAYILQLDLKRAFASMSRPEFFAYFKSYAADTKVVEFLNRLINGWMNERPGIPLVNDSLFFLGNAYLNTVDVVIGQHSDNFIRFLDDYRLFGDTRSELEKAFVRISRDLERTGFTINQKKVRLGSRSDYLRAISTIQRSEDSKAMAEMDTRESLGPMLFVKVIEPHQLVRFIEIALENPEDYLTVRLGRLLLREIRKLRTNASVGSELHKDFSESLAGNQPLRKRILELISQYLRQDVEEWRLVWLLYLLEDVILVDAKANQEHRLIESASRAANLNPIVGLWAKRLLSQRKQQHQSSAIFERQDVNYLDEGRLLYGGIK